MGAWAIRWGQTRLMVFNVGEGYVTPSTLQKFRPKDGNTLISSRSLSLVSGYTSSRETIGEKHDVSATTVGEDAGARAAVNGLRSCRAGGELARAAGTRHRSLAARGQHGHHRADPGR